MFHGPVLDWRRRDGKALGAKLLADVAELLHRAELDLSNSLSGDVEFASDLFKGA